MAERAHIDEATLLWAAAVVGRVDPVAAANGVDVDALVRVVTAADDAPDPLSTAAGVLFNLITSRPFPSSNAAIGWLAATELLARVGCRVVVSSETVVSLCDAVRDGCRTEDQVAASLRSWMVVAGTACPVCGRRVYANASGARRTSMPGSARFELTARCAFEHRVHDKLGRAIARPFEPSPESRQPVLARGACGSLLIAGPDGAGVGGQPVFVRPDDAPRRRGD